VSGFEHVLEEGGRFEISVLSGDDCSTCVTYVDFIFDDADSHTVEWMAEPNVKYTILVAGEDYTDVGYFIIELQEGFPEALQQISSVLSNKRMSVFRVLTAAVLGASLTALFV
jgi:hypothetical protein